MGNKYRYCKYDVLCAFRFVPSEFDNTKDGRQYMSSKTCIFRPHGKAGRDCTQDVAAP